MTPILLLSLCIVASLGHENFDYDVYEEEDEDFDVPSHHRGGDHPGSWGGHEPDHEYGRSRHPDEEHHERKKEHSPLVLRPASGHARKPMGHQTQSGRHPHLRSQRAKDPRYREGLNDLAGLM
ncbi:hypothetical protein SprV_0602084200 [Sparganum proliferum]